MTVENYVGEFLISPMPTELSLHYCSHACHYCFANLNNRTRAANVPAILRQLDEYPQRVSLVAHWLREGYGVCFSNRVDPFAARNARDTRVIVERMVERGVAVQFQTRGAHRPEIITEVLDLLPTACVWYISLEVWDETIRTQIAPGAPSIASRLALIEELRARGHRVVIGLNPCVAEWLPGTDVEQLLDAVAVHGAEGVWIERLHFSYTQRNKMTPRERGAIGEPLIRRAMKRYTDHGDREFLDRARAATRARGMEVFSIGQPEASDFFAPYHQVYRTIPTMQDFINACHAEREPGALVSWAEFTDFFVPHLPPGTYPIDGYLGSTARQLWRTEQIAPQMTFEELLGILYRDPRCKLCPARLPSFAYAAQWDGDGWIQLVDEQGMPYLVWSPSGHDDYYCDVRAELQEVV